jgi:hypothetical protein
MSGHINDIVPLIRKHFDFLVTDWGYECVRTWNEYMSRYQGAEYHSARATVFVEQADSPILDVRIMDRQAHRGSALDLEEIVREADPEAWSRRPQGHAWPRPIEQDDEQLRFLSECTRRFCGGWLQHGFANAASS